MTTTDENLERLNSLSAAEAETELLKCCGSAKWARAVTGRRPFNDAGELFRAAEEVWWNLTERDWLEAFAAHPKIGGGRSKDARTQHAEAEAWSAQEQSGTRDATRDTLDELAEGNRAYEAKFGHIYIVCATGKTAEEMLALLRARLSNTAAAELRNAATEQSKITRLRLEKLLKSQVRSDIET
ncbi:MAG TPA: 2-oxo-4-hydroxy-4-carboxy-5-ureidoimidazoline decarboxylase [Pyrinomonadaceae bacterium]|nr:2-oxo-4-hydroxy-4-carboxy-5-ureidoimidazoline decarboxylase [Pyrinomonadaceae bacterium]